MVTRYEAPALVEMVRITPTLTACRLRVELAAMEGARLPGDVKLLALQFLGLVTSPSLIQSKFHPHP